jgi:hypothetical protein
MVTAEIVLSGVVPLTMKLISDDFLRQAHASIAPGNVAGSCLKNEARAIGGSGKADSIRRECEASLWRLKVRLLRPVANRHGRSPGEAAVA